MNIILADGIICDRDEMAKVFPYTRLLGLRVVLCDDMRKRLPDSGQGRRNFREPPASYMSSPSPIHHDSHTRQGGHYGCTVPDEGPSHNNQPVQPVVSMSPRRGHLIDMGTRPR